MFQFTQQRAARIILTVLPVILLVACGAAQAQELPYVDLSQRESIPAVAPAEVIPLRLAVAAIISPQGTAESYGNLARYLGQKLGRPVELVQRRTYAEANELIERGQADLAFVCTSAYVAGHDEFGMELLLAPEVNGKQVYYLVLIVPARSPAQSMADLQGTIFAFTNPMSHSGRVYPTTCSNNWVPLRMNFSAAPFLPTATTRLFRPWPRGWPRALRWIAWC